MASGATKTPSNGSNGTNRISEWKLKEQMCDIGRRIWQKGFCAGNEGNHSYRLSADRVLCTPTGISKGNLKPDDLCVVDMEGKQVSGKRKRTSEILMHLAIYKARPDVKCVIHSHPPHATAFAVAGVELDRKSTRLNSSHTVISYAVFCLKKKKFSAETNNRKPNPNRS